jgi:hypothetical protein
VVRVWNYVLNFFSVTAQIKSLCQTQDVLAQPSGTPEDKQVTQMILVPGSFEDDKMYVTSTMIEKEGEPFVIFRILPWLHRKALLKVTTIKLLRSYMSVVHFSSGIIQQTYAATLRVGVMLNNLARRVVTRIKVHRPIRETIPMVAKVYSQGLQGVGTLIAKVAHVTLTETALLKAVVRPIELIRSIVHSMVKVVKPQVEGKILLKVFTMPMDITYKLYTMVKIKRVQLDKSLAYITHAVYWRYVAKEARNIVMELPRNTVQAASIKLANSRLGSHSIEIRANLNHMTNKMRVLAQLGKSQIGKWVNFFLPTMSKRKRGVLLDIRLKQTVPAKINLVVTNKTIIKTLVEWQVLATLRDGGINFIIRPYSLLYKTLIMANLNGTKFTSLLSVQTSGLNQEAKVAFNVCNYFKRGLIQWYLHSNVVSNEGYTNEIIFDLGQVEPVGPLPPIPIEEWKGGYVEYPFKGMGHADTGNAGGYLSPEGDAWVKNVQMVWTTPTQIFDGEE